MKYLISFIRKICHISVACILLVAFFVSVDLSPARAAEGITFSWSANPVEDEVVGYRLYYGQESRFTAGHTTNTLILHPRSPVLLIQMDMAVKH